MFKHIILAVVFTFALSFTARAEDPATPPPVSPPPGQQQPNADGTTGKPVARREDVEPKTLPEASAALKKARSERDDAEAKLLAEEDAHTKTKELLRGTLDAAKTAQTERDKAQADFAAATKERDDSVAAHGKTKELLTLAEAAAGLKGVPPKQAVAVAAETSDGEKLTAAQWDAKFCAEKDPAKRAALREEFSKAAREGRIAK